MSDRRLAALVGIAVVGGAAVAGVGLATQGSGKPARVLQIDEQAGRVGAVVLGETRENVIGALGQPRSTHGAAPVRAAHRQYLFYPHLTVGLLNDRVVWIQTDDPAARTDKVVRVGDPLSAARASYRKAAKCKPNSPDKTAKHPHCVVKVPAGTLLVVGDPIRSLTLDRR